MSQILDLGKLRFRFAGDFNPATEYEINDCVRYGGNTYVYTNVVRTTGTLPTAATHWQVLTEGLRQRGAFTPGTEYLPGDVVYDGLSTYSAKQTLVAGASIAADAAKWQALARGQANVPDPTVAAAGSVLVVQGGAYAAVAEVATKSRLVTAARTLDAGYRYTSNTEAGSFTVLLPAAPVPGDWIEISDGGGVAQGNYVTVSPNGKSIEGSTETLVLNMPHAVVTFTFINNTNGWKVN